MLEKGKISSRQAMYLIVNVILPTAILFLPQMMYVEAKQDAWLSAFIAIAYGLLVGEIFIRLCRRFPEQTVVEYAPRLLGTVAGFITGLIYVAFFLHIDAYIVREFAELLVTNFLSETPIIVIIVSIVAATTYSVRHGLEVMARLNEIILPLMFLMLATLLTVNISGIKLENLLPVLENGPIPPLMGFTPTLVFFAETVVILMLAPYINRPFEPRPLVTRAVLTVGLLQLLTVLLIITVLGDLTRYMLFPALVLARVRIGAFISSIDPVILLFWIMGGFIKIAVFQYCAVLGAAQLFRLKNYGPVAVASGIVLVVLADVLWKNSAELASQIAREITPFFLTVEVAIPLLLLIVAAVRQMGGPDRNAR